MKLLKINRLMIKTLCYTILACISSSFVCKNEDVNCTVLSAKYVVKAQEVANSISNGSQLNCDELQKLYNDFYELVRDGKNCENIKAALESSGFSSIDELITKYDLELSKKGC